MLFLYIYLFLIFNIINIATNYMHFNQYFILYLNYYTTLLNFNLIYLWFIVFMFIILLILVYYTYNNIYSNNNSTLLYILYIILYYIICLLFISEDCLLFIIAFETMLFTILATSMYFLFNNSFIIAIYYLIIFSIISGLGCFFLLFTLLIHINISGYMLFLNALVLNNFNILLILWSTIFIVFGINFPIYPFYFWLLAVHVEVSSEMSTLLAGIILNSGFIGIFNFLLIFLASITFILSNINVIFIFIGLFMCTINLLIITDYNNIIGSWSILHVNVTLIFVWYNNYLLLILFILSNLGHILSSSSFFLCISFTYENFNNNHLFMISSCFSFNIYSFLFIFLILNNIDFPFFLLFYIELLNFFAIIFISNYLLLLLVGIILTLFVSSLLLYFILNYYETNWNNAYISLDMNISEAFFFVVLIIYGLVLYWFLTIF